MQFVEKRHEDLDEDVDLRALENGFVSSHLPPSLPLSPLSNGQVFTPLYNLQISVTPLNVHGQVEPEMGPPASDWLSAAVSLDKEKDAAPAAADQQDVAAEEKEAPLAA